MLNGSPEDLANTLYGLIEETKISLLVSSIKIILALKTREKERNCDVLFRILKFGP